MKLLYIFVVLVLLSGSSAIFISCKDSPVESGQAFDYFNWTIVDTNIIVRDMYLGDAHNVYTTGFQNYKITDGVKTEIVDADFQGTSVTGYDKDYAVFSGSNTSNHGKIKIYNNGTITDYTPDNYYNDMGNIYVIERGKFLYQTNWFSFALFNNGTITDFMMPDTSSIEIFSRVGNTLYVFGRKYIDTVSVFKFENNQLTFIKKMFCGALYNFSTEPMMVTADVQGSIFVGELSYFNGSIWTPFLSITDGYFYNASAESHSFGIVSVDYGLEGISIESWNGNHTNKEKNFPVKNLGNFPKYSNYKDNTIYISCFSDRLYLVKGNRIIF